ncbi:endonuclease domain-containing protein [Roseiterribacter gracilis]|uniref:DUF559 domain-containing protein n=1 Tax=Roseiterribacter gracilis TaxID=2812848 RepID=A0A8S8XCE5_9PROT|nr:hypothetical protein TMPK1_12020 [Rhodospirillales bacterium TMPK1]
MSAISGAAPPTLVELDGSQHADPATRDYDVQRTAFLNKSGWYVLRFWNNDVQQNLDGVLKTILLALNREPSP